MHIPIIDIKNLYSDVPSETDSIADDFIEAYSSLGFSYITNHSIDNQIISDVFDASK